jgi:hypothetical protein
MGELGDQACGPGATVKTITQPRFFNLGQPEGYSPVPCPRCGGSGTAGGSKCPKCAGHGRVYVEDAPYPTWVMINASRWESVEQMNGTPDFVITWEPGGWRLKWRSSSAATVGFLSVRDVKDYVRDEFGGQK